MVKEPKVLVVTSSFGSGHKQVSNALKSEFELSNIKDVTVIDLYEEAYPTLNSFAKSVHLQIFQHAQMIYKWFFYGSEKICNTAIFDMLLELSGKKIKSILQNEKPDIIITTFPVGTVAKWKKNSGHPCKLFTVVTDYYIHRAWIHEEIDRYYIATEHLKNQMVELGVSLSKIYVSGIPLRKEFREVNQRNNETNHQSNSQILIVAGAFGILKDVEKITKQLLTDPKHNVMVVCGNNRVLYKSLSELEGNYIGRLKVFGYVNDIQNLYKKADLLITKPGGITLAESIACSLPTILYRPTPGQESENSRVFENVGASVLAKTKKELIENVERILSRPNDLDRMKLSLKNLYKGVSSQLIVDDIFKSIS